MSGPMALSFSPPLHPGPQPIRGTTTAHGSPPLKGSSREGSHRHTQKRLHINPSKLIINIISSQRRRVHRNPKKPLSQHIILFWRIHPKATLLRATQRFTCKCAYCDTHYVEELQNKLTQPGMVAHSYYLSIQEFHRTGGIVRCRPVWTMEYGLVSENYWMEIQPSDKVICVPCPRSWV